VSSIIGHRGTSKVSRTVHPAWQNCWRIGKGWQGWSGRGTWWHQPSFCVASVALGDINLRFAGQAWHLATSTFVLRGRRGMWWHRREHTNFHTDLFHTHLSHTTLKTHLLYTQSFHTQPCTHPVSCRQLFQAQLFHTQTWTHLNIQQNILLSICFLVRTVEVRSCSIQGALGKLLRKPRAKTSKVQSLNSGLDSPIWFRLWQPAAPQTETIMVEHLERHSSCMSSHTQELPAGTFTPLIIGLFVGHPPMMRRMAPCVLNYILLKLFGTELTRTQTGTAPTLSWRPCNNRSMRNLCFDKVQLVPLSCQTLLYVENYSVWSSGPSTWGSANGDEDCQLNMHHEFAMVQLDDGWPESVEEQGLLLLVLRHDITRQCIKHVW